jgi:hypothetical protein
MSMFVSLADPASENVTQRRHSTQEKISSWLAGRLAVRGDKGDEMGDFRASTLRKTRETSRLSLYL